MRAAVLALLLVLGPAGAAATPQVKAAFHVHTTFSTGARPLAEVAAEARQRGIGAVVLTENLLVRFEYGLFPFRGIVRKVVEQPSVARTGLAGYLQAVEEAQARFPDVVLIPGVEVIPYYYWAGSLLGGDLAMWDAQKNLLVVGLTRAEDLAALPAIGHGPALPAAASLPELGVAAVAVGGGAWLLRWRRQRTLQLRHFRLRVERRYRLAGGTVLAGGLLLGLDALGSAPLNPYRGPLGIAPYQAVIDFAESRGGLAVWSFPEARDFGRFAFGPLGTVTVRTDAHPDVLLESRGYTAFGAVYAETVTLTDPGRQWDRLLGEYATGVRPRPAWGVGEVGYHGPPKPLDETLTVCVAEPERAALLRALREGRCYALQGLPGYHVVLEEFRARPGPGDPGAPMGGEVEARGSEPLWIEVRLAASDGRAVPVAGRLIRSGRVAEVLEGTTPLRVSLPLPPPPPGRREFVRLEVTRPHRLLSNPIFLGRRA